MLAEQDPLVNTVTKQTQDEIDWEKANIYPLVNIGIDGGSFTNGQTVRLAVVIDVNMRRNINDQTVSDKFWGQDNEVDNLNTCFAILNRMWTNIFRDFQDLNYGTDTNPAFEFGRLEKDNIVDGVQMSFEVEMRNDELSLCLPDLPTPLSPSGITDGGGETIIFTWVYPPLGNTTGKLTDVYRLEISSDNFTTLDETFTGVMTERPEPYTPSVGVQQWRVRAERGQDSFKKVSEWAQGNDIEPEIP